MPADLNIQGYRQRTSIKETATSLSWKGKFMKGERFPVPPSRLGYDIGTRQAPHLRLQPYTMDGTTNLPVMDPLTNQPAITHPVTNDTTEFFNRLPGSAPAPNTPIPTYTLAINRDGAPTTWRPLNYKARTNRLGLFETMTTRWKLAGLDLTKVTEESVTNRGTQLEMTQITSGPWDLPIEALSGGIYSMEQIRTWTKPEYGFFDHAEIDTQREELVLHFQCRALNLPDGQHFEAPPATVRLGLGHLGLPRDVFESIYTGHDPRYQTDLVTYEERLDSKSIVRTMDSDPSIRQGSYEDDLLEDEPVLFFRFNTCRKVAVPLPEAVAVPDGAQVTLVDVRSAVRYEHLDDFNGRKPGTVEWLPYDRAFRPSFLEKLHYNSDPATPFGSGVESGNLLMFLSGQCFSADVTKKVYDKKSVWTRLAQCWTIFDQLLFFGQQLTNILSWPYGPVANYKKPWYVQTGGRASILYSKALKTWEALCTGSNFVVRALWQRLFPRIFFGLVNFVIFGTMLDHYNIITEDCNLSHGSKDIFGLVVKFTYLAKAIATSVSSFAQAILQRGRWLASLLAFMATSYYYLYRSALASVGRNLVHRVLPPELARKICKPFAPFFKSAMEWLERANTNNFYFDTIKEVLINNFPALYILFNLKPLIAGPNFLIGPWVVMFLAWLSYVNQSTKNGQDPFQVFFPWPRFIHAWKFIAGGVAPNAIHAQNIGSGAFAQTGLAGGVLAEAGAKRTAVLSATAGIGVGLLGMGKLLYQMEIFLPEVVVPTSLIMAGGIGLSMWWDRYSDEHLPPPEERSLTEKAFNFAIRSTSLFGSMAGVYMVMKTMGHGADGDSFDPGLFMNSFWSLFNGGGWASSCRTYMTSQQYHRDQADAELAAGLLDQKGRNRFFGKGTDTWSSFLYQGYCLDLLFGYLKKKLGRSAK